jgi:carbon-monoxide dehydrogenase medium subunit
VVEAASLIGSAQVQGRASLGGNLCNAFAGGRQRAGADRSGRGLPRAGPAGRRELPVEQLQAGPGRNTLAAGEVLVALRLPRPAPRSGRCLPAPHSSRNT